MKNKKMLIYLQNFCKYKRYLQCKNILTNYEINYFNEVIAFNLNEIKKELNF